MAVVRKVPRPLPDPVIPPARYRCACPGCKNKVPFHRFTCQECFLYCDDRKKSAGHRVRKLRRRSA